jgi:hypothetical protein
VVAELGRSAIKNMHSLYIIFIGLAIVSVEAHAQEIKRPVPRVQIVDAINQAGNYIKKHNVDVSKHFLSCVQYHDSGSWTNSSLGKGPYWQVTYEFAERYVDGGQIFILVYMDKSIGITHGE